MAWWETLFDDRYARLWGPLASPEIAQKQADSIVAYLDLQPGDSVLDLACGYGRVAIPLAQRGFEVTGLDLSATLLGQARAAAQEAGVQVAWHQGDMREIPWSDRFDAVINVFSSFGYFADEEENRRVLNSAARALRRPRPARGRRGGRFLIDVVNRDWRVRQDIDRYWFEAGNLTVLADPWLDPVAGRAGETWRWQEDGQWQSLEFDVRLYTATELKALIESAGLHRVTIYGGWEREPFGPQCHRIIAVAEQ